MAAARVGVEVEVTAPDDCHPFDADRDPSTTRFTHDAMWASCHGPGSYTVHAEWTPDWKGSAPYSAQTTEGEHCPTSSPSPTP